MMKVLHKDFFVDGDFGNGYMEEVHNSNFFYGINLSCIWEVKLEILVA